VEQKVGGILIGREIKSTTIRPAVKAKTLEPMSHSRKIAYTFAEK